MLAIPILFIILLGPLLASFWVKHNFKKYSQVANAKAISGREVAEAILERNGLSVVSVHPVSGTLSDCYSSGRKKCVCLSDEVYSGQSIAALAVAAHECGHALQDRDAYTFMRFRSAFYPVLRFVDKAGYVAIVIGMFFPFLGLDLVGVAMVFCTLIFEVITLPVEFDASRRALQVLKEMELVGEAENDGVRAVLRSAALTYVAGMLSTLFTLLRMLSRSRSR